MPQHQPYPDEPAWAPRQASADRSFARLRLVARGDRGEDDCLVEAELGSGADVDSNDRAFADRLTTLGQDVPEWVGQASEPGPDGSEPESAGMRQGDAGRRPNAAAQDRTAAVDDATLADWMQRIVDRDERALAALYDACMPRVAALVQRIVRRAALTEEVVEDVFWQVWRQAPRFDLARGRVWTWLLAIGRSRAIDALRRNERFCHEELSDDDSLGDGAPSGGADELLAATRAGTAVHAALAGLDARSRQLVALAFFRGLTHEEIAQQCRLPLGTAKSLIRRALAQLRRQLESQGVSP